MRHLSYVYPLNYTPSKQNGANLFLSGAMRFNRLKTGSLIVNVFLGRAHERLLDDKNEGAYN
jgi:hypothetical protein